MESLSFYLRTTVSEELQRLYSSVLSHFDTFGVDIHIAMIDSLLATADDRETAETLAFLEAIIYDQVHAILLAHRIDAAPTSMMRADHYLRALSYYQSLGGDEFVYGMLASDDSPEEIWATLVAYACHTQAEDYLEEIRRVDPEALSTIQLAISNPQAVEDDDYNEDDSDAVRRASVPWVKQRVMAYRAAHPQDTVVIQSITHHGMKLGVHIEVLWAALEDAILDLPEAEWPHEMLSLALASRCPEQEIAPWVSERLSRYTDDPVITKNAQQIMHLHLTPTE